MRLARILFAAFAIGWCSGAAAQNSDAGAAADIQSYVDYGDSLRVQGRFAEAAEVYSRAIEKAGVPDVDDWELFYSRAICYEQNGQWDKAEPDFRMALKLQPNQPLVLNYLGYMLIDTGQNLAEGMEMVRKAVEISPNDGYAIDSLGWGYFRLGDFARAVTELERAIALQPDDWAIRDHLGDAYWRTGRTDEAKAQWRRARDLGAEGQELELILKKIAEGLVESAPDTPEGDKSRYASGGSKR